MRGSIEWRWPGKISEQAIRPKHAVHCARFIVRTRKIVQGGGDGPTTLIILPNPAGRRFISVRDDATARFFGVEHFLPHRWIGNTAPRGFPQTFGFQKGFFRPTKKWDLLIHSDERLLAAIELKSHVGPSFGNNCNNRAEEALGNATDFWTAHREGAFGKSPRPFLGYIMLLEDCPPVHAKPARALKPSYFDVFEEFRWATYADRYRLLCEKLMLESLYTSAAVILSPRNAATTGQYSELSEAAGLGSFIAELRGKLLAQADRDEQVTVRIREEPPGA